MPVVTQPVSHLLDRSTEADHPEEGVPERDARRLEAGLASGRSSAAVRTASEGFRALSAATFSEQLAAFVKDSRGYPTGVGLWN